MAQLLDALRPGWRDESGDLAELLGDAVRDARRVSLTDDIVGARDEAKALAAVTRVANALSAARTIDPSRWPHVRLVPSPLHESGHATAVSVGDEVVVVLDASTPAGPRTEGILVAAASHVAAGSCPAADITHGELGESEAVAQRGLDARAWWVANGAL